MPTVAYHIVKHGTRITTVYNLQDADFWVEMYHAEIKIERLLKNDAQAA